MRPNLIWHTRGDSQGLFVEVLDESLVNYGFENGDVVPVLSGDPAPGGIPVWELDGNLHGRFIEHQGLGWARACTSLLSAGEIRYSLDPAMMAKITEVGWIWPRSH